jgi:hypothetical protein
MITRNNGKDLASGRGVVVISIDTEQIWGYLDLTDESGFAKRFPYSISVHDRLLGSLCAANISATWTVVGALALGGTSGPRDSRFAGLPKEWIRWAPAGDEQSAPLWYRRSFVTRLHHAHPAQDIGIHGGMSHLIWGNSRTSSETVCRELGSGIRALEEIGIRPRALVFPRNLVAHLEILARYGIRCYRGRAPVLSEKVGLRHSLAGRAARLVEEMGRLTPRTVWPEEVLPGLWNIPASLNLYTMRPSAARLAPLGTRLERVRRGIEAAVRQSQIFHFWFHPENLAEASWSYPTFEAILEELVRWRDAGDIEILTMNQVVDRITECQVKSAAENRPSHLWNIPIEVRSRVRKVREKSLQGQGLARFMELRGRRVVEAAGVLWCSMDGRLYRSIPFQLDLDPDPRELEEMLRLSRGLGANFPSRNRAGIPSGLYVCRRRDYDITSVARGFRGKVRRGLGGCEIRRVDDSELLHQGMQLNLDTMERQGRYDPEFGEPTQWKRLVEAVRRSPSITVWGAFVNGRLAAYRITFREDGWLFVLHHMSRTDELDNCPNHALDFEITREIAKDRDLEAISLGTLGLVSSPGLHEYKLRLGYEVSPRNWVFQLHPAVSPVATTALIAKAANLARHLRPRDQRLKLVSIVLEGARLSRQGDAASRPTALPTAAMLSGQGRTTP